MIEIVSETRCIQCNQCVSVCPKNVFDHVENGVPVIARQSDCQACFMCELYCPVDALYVEPDADVVIRVNEKELEREGLLGGYREKVGWGKGRTPVSSNKLIYELAVKTSY